MKNKTILLIASGDLRLSANQNCWVEQEAMEADLCKLGESMGYTIKRAHAYDPVAKHGFISSQRQGMDIFSKIDRSLPIIVAEAVWQYSHHILAGLISHKGPILTLANWSGKWPGLVGMLNLNGSLTKANVAYSSLWSEDFFRDAHFKSQLSNWLEYGTIEQDTSHVSPYTGNEYLSESVLASIKSIVETMDRVKCIMGVFDEFCMGMYNAAIPDELLFERWVSIKNA